MQARGDPGFPGLPRTCVECARPMQGHDSTEAVCKSGANFGLVTETGAWPAPRVGLRQGGYRASSFRHRRAPDTLQYC